MLRKMIPKLPTMENSTPLWYLAKFWDSFARQSHRQGPLISLKGENILCWQLAGRGAFLALISQYIFIYLFIYLVLVCFFFVHCSFVFVFVIFFFGGIIFLFSCDFFYYCYYLFILISFLCFVLVGSDEVPWNRKRRIIHQKFCNN